MEQGITNGRLSPGELDVTHRLAEVVRENDLGKTIVLYFESEFLAVNTVYPLRELVFIPPLDRELFLAVGRKGYFDIVFNHEDLAYIITLREGIFAAVDGELGRGADILH